MREMGLLPFARSWTLLAKVTRLAACRDNLREALELFFDQRPKRKSIVACLERYS